MDKERIDGFRSAFAVSDHYALEFMRFLQGQGIRVPEDVQIIGFDDTLASRESVPALTTIHQDVHQKAVLALRKLLLMAEGKEPAEKNVKSPVWLVKRDSVKE